MENTVEIEIDTIIDKLVKAAGNECKSLTEAEVRSVIQKSREILVSQPMLL